MAKIKFSFARGGHFTAKVMLDKAPKTWEAIRKQLPLTIKAYNARWTGRETHTSIASATSSISKAASRYSR